MARSIRSRAQKMCDANRRKKPHLWFFIGDPPCAHCMRRARERAKKAEA